MAMAAPSMPHFLDVLPKLRGRAQVNAPVAPFTWFRVGGPAEALVRPTDAADLAQFLAASPLRDSGLDVERVDAGARDIAL